MQIGIMDMIQKEKKDCIITIHRHEIAYDVELVSWRIAKTHFAQSSDKDAYEAKISGEVAEWLDREISSAVSEVKRRISFAVRNDNEAKASNAVGACCEGGQCEVADNEKTVINLQFDNGWRGRADVLASDIHDFIVAKALFNWLVMVAPSFASVYAEKADRHIARIVDEARSEVIRTPRFIL
jgi:hypothetical protein